MSEQKKDLTGLMDYAQAMKDAGHEAPVPAGSILEEQKIEKIDDFESLDEYGKNNPAPEPAEEPILGDDPFAVTPPTENHSGMDFSDSTAAPFEEAIAPLVIAEPEPEPAPDAPPLQPQAPLERIKQYSESLSPGKASAPAAFPFSLLITGRLADDEKARLLDLLSRENMGIRELDLEPQLESGKILIPRISEYAGVLLVAALRGAQVRMRLGPSDTIFATADTQDAVSETFDNGERVAHAQVDGGGDYPEDLPMTMASELPGVVRYQVLDVVTASGALRSAAVEAESSIEFNQLLEALKRELRYKAFRKGATAILNLNVQLTALQLPSQYRLMVSGSAVKA